MTKLGNHVRLLVTLTAAAVAGGACEKKDDASKPTGVPAMAGEPAAAPAAPPAAAPTPPPAAAPTPPPPAAAAEPPAAPAAAAGGTIVGQITLPAARKKDVSPGDTIFLVARRISDNPSARGSLVAVKKLTADKFPIDFTLSGADMPFQTGPFDGELTISVRVDKDGNPMSHMKGDVFGTLAKVKVGAKNVKIPLDQLQKEDESLAQPGGPMGGPPPMGGPMQGPMGGKPPGHP